MGKEKSGIPVNSPLKMSVKGETALPFGVVTDTMIGTWDGKNKTYYQTTAPSSGMTAGDLWFDTDDDYKAYRYNGSTWDLVRDGELIALSTNIGNGTILLSANTTYSGAWYLNTGVALHATYGLSLFGGHVAFRTFADSSAYATWLAGANIDSLTGVQCYVGTDGKISAAAGKVTLDSSGINIWGVNNALTTRATVDGTIQCSVNSDGHIVAGAGAVKLSSAGLTITNPTGDSAGYLYFVYNTTTAGHIKASATNELRMYAVANGIVEADGSLSLYGGTTVGIQAESGDLTLTASDEVHINPTTATNIARLTTTSSSVTGSRAIDTTYTNSGTKPLLVIVTILCDTDEYADLKIHASADPPTTIVCSTGIADAGLAQTYSILVGIVPVGWKYRVVATGSSAINVWTEVAIG